MDDFEERRRRRVTVFIRIGDPTMAMTQEQRDEFWRRVQEHEGPGRPVRPAGTSSFEHASPPLPGDSYGLVQAARRAWESDPKLRVEFGDCFERYVAFAMADQKGLVKIFSRSRNA